MTNIQVSNVAVLYGGDSAEREVSLNSGAAIAKGLQQAGFNVTLIDSKGYDIANLKSESIDFVFIALHGRGGEDGSLQGALDTLNIPYTGSGVLGAALSMDKIRSKQVMQAMAIPTAAFAIAIKTEYQEADSQTLITNLGGKVMVKPANEGSSIGMAKAENAEQLHQALISAFDYDSEVLIEAWIEGPEYTVSILGDQALPAIRMETPNEFYDYQAKYQSSETLYHCPCGLAESDEKELQTLALKAFRATGAQIWGRVDVMQDAKGHWQVLEVNTVPGMTETSLVPKAAKAKDISFSDLVAKIIHFSAREKYTV